MRKCCCIIHVDCRYVIFPISKTNVIPRRIKYCDVFNDKCILFCRVVNFAYKLASVWFRSMYLKLVILRKYFRHACHFALEHNIRGFTLYLLEIWNYIYFFFLFSHLSVMLSNVKRLLKHLLLISWLQRTMILTTFPTSPKLPDTKRIDIIYNFIMYLFLYPYKYAPVVSKNGYLPIVKMPMHKENFMYVSYLWVFLRTCVKKQPSSS